MRIGFKAGPVWVSTSTKRRPAKKSDDGTTEFAILFAIVVSVAVLLGHAHHVAAMIAWLVICAGAGIFALVRYFRAP